jgi:hypothetical protein
MMSDRGEHHLKVDDQRAVDGASIDVSASNPSPLGGRAPTASWPTL